MDILENARLTNNYGIGYLPTKSIKNMTKKSLFLLTLMIPSMWCMASCNSIGKKHQPVVSMPQPDSTVYAMLGRTMSDVLFSPQKVTCWRLKPKAEPTANDYQVEPHWARDSLIGQLTPQMYGVLQFLLLNNPECYRHDSVLVRSPYFPRVEFEFVKKKTVVHVVVSLADYSWSAMYDDKCQFNFNYADKELIDRFCQTILGEDIK